MKSIGSYSDKLSRLVSTIDRADAIVVGAGAGLSTSAGLAYDGPRFQENFKDYIDKYHFADMYSATFYPYDSLEEYWAYMSRHIQINRYDATVGAPYANLLELIKNKDYFIITTNVDHQFQKAGFEKSRLFYTQGDYGLWQCSVPCHDETYDNETVVTEMVKEQSGLRIPSELVPRCPKCGKPMAMNLRCDHTFVQDSGWQSASARYDDFIRRHETGNVLYLELGVGGNTPVIIKYPFWLMTAKNPAATYVCINLYEAVCMKEIESQSICIDADVGQVIERIAKMMNQNNVRS